MKRWFRPLVAIALVAASAYATTGVAQASTPQVTNDGNYCAYYVPTKTMACVADEADLAAAKATALGISPAEARRGVTPAAS